MSVYKVQMLVYIVQGTMYKCRCTMYLTLTERGVEAPDSRKGESLDAWSEQWKMYYVVCR